MLELDKKSELLSFSIRSIASCSKQLNKQEREQKKSSLRFVQYQSAEIGKGSKTGAVLKELTP